MFSATARVTGKRMASEQTEFEQLDRNTIHAEHLSALIFVSVFSVSGLIAWSLFGLVGWGFGDSKTWVTFFVGAFLLALLAWWSYQYPFLRWKTTRYRVTERGFELHRGVYWQHKIFVPRERIQHTDVTQGPISRKFRIAELVINTAGNHNYLIKVEGLNVERANEMRLALLPRVKQHTKLEEPVQPEEPAKPGVPS
jgi:membrane protein YdbS with pleckstrin-like domain